MSTHPRNRALMFEPTIRFDPSKGPGLAPQVYVNGEAVPPLPSRRTAAEAQEWAAWLARVLGGVPLACAVLALAAAAVGCAFGRVELSREPTIVVDNEFTAEEFADLLTGAGEWAPAGLRPRFVSQTHRDVQTVDKTPWHEDVIWVFRMRPGEDCPGGHPDGPWSGVTWRSRTYPVAYVCLKSGPVDRSWAASSPNVRADMFAHELGHAFQLPDLVPTADSVMTEHWTGPVRGLDVEWFNSANPR